MGDRSSFSFFFLKRERERERETGVGGREVGQMDRAARKNFFWQRCSFLWQSREWGGGAKLDSAEASELPFSAQKLIWYSLSVTESHIMKIQRAGLLDAAADKLYKEM